MGTTLEDLVQLAGVQASEATSVNLRAPSSEND